jgi:galactose mutarotase-like enzyme
MTTTTRRDAISGRITSFRVAGTELLAQQPVDLRRGCYPLAPWAGRVRDAEFSFEGVTHRLPPTDPPHAIHGTVADRPWDVVADGLLRCDLGTDWPFAGYVEQRVELTPDVLRVTLALHATEQAMPATLGWHPWWRRDIGAGGPLEVRLDARQQLVRDGAGIATGAVTTPRPGPHDDCFTGLRSAPVLSWPGALDMTVDSDCAYVVVCDTFDDGVGVEPQTGPPDALNHTPHVIHPGSPLTAEMRLSWTVMG